MKENNDEPTLHHSKHQHRHHSSDPMSVFQRELRKKQKRQNLLKKTILNTVTFLCLSIIGYFAYRNITEGYEWVNEDDKEIKGNDTPIERTDSIIIID